MMMMIHVCIT